MAEGRCSLSSYATGKSPNMNGVCSPASHVRYREDGDELVSELGDFTINRFPAERAGRLSDAVQGPLRRRRRATATSSRIPSASTRCRTSTRSKAAGVTALKIEGRQRGTAYVAKVVAEIRRQLDAADRTSGRLARRRPRAA